MSSKSRTQWDERKQKTTASWTCYMKNRKTALHFAIRVYLAHTGLCENFHRGTHQQDKGRRHFLHWGDWHLHKTEDCSWETIPTWQSYFRCYSLAKQNWRGTAEGKAVVWKSRSPTVCQGAVRRVQSRLGQEAFLGGKDIAWDADSLPKPYSCTKTLTATPEPEQEWTSLPGNIIALAGENLVWRLVWVNREGLLCVCTSMCVCIYRACCQGLIFNDASLLELITL